MAMVAAMAAALALTNPAPAQEVKLTLADQNSPTGWGPSHALYPWIKQVEEASKGKVKIEVFASQTLIKGIDMWEGIKSGTPPNQRVGAGGYGARQRTPP